MILFNNKWKKYQVIQKASRVELKYMNTINNIDNVDSYIKKQGISETVLCTLSDIVDALPDKYRDYEPEIWIETCRTFKRKTNDAMERIVGRTKKYYKQIETHFQKSIRKLRSLNKYDILSTEWESLDTRNQSAFVDALPEYVIKTNWDELKSEWKKFLELKTHWKSSPLKFHENLLKYGYDKFVTIISNLAIRNPYIKLVFRYHPDSYYMESISYNSLSKISNKNQISIEIKGIKSSDAQIYNSIFTIKNIKFKVIAYFINQQ